MVLPVCLACLIITSSSYKLYFLSRHGSTHGLAPHQINFRANALALKELGIQFVFATNAVGSLRTDLSVGSFVVIDDFIDFTRHRPNTLFDNGEWRHTDFSAPYNLLLRRCLLQTAEHLRRRSWRRAAVCLL